MNRGQQWKGDIGSLIEVLLSLYNCSKVSHVASIPLAYVRSVNLQNKKLALLDAKLLEGAETLFCRDTVTTTGDWTTSYRICVRARSPDTEFSQIRSKVT